MSAETAGRSHKARYVLRGFEEDVKNEDVFASTTLTASAPMLLSFAIDQKSEGYTVVTAIVKTAVFNANMRDGVVLCSTSFRLSGSLRPWMALSKHLCGSWRGVSMVCGMLRNVGRNTWRTSRRKQVLSQINSTFVSGHTLEAISTCVPR